jgi:hypothetical protein
MNEREKLIEILVNRKKKRYDELSRISHIYLDEVKKCIDSKAYLSGCIMLGAALETRLLLEAYLRSDEIKPLLKTKSGKSKPITKLVLSELLCIAKTKGWLPNANLYLPEGFDPDKAKIGDYAEIIHALRNLVHPTRYISDFYGRIIEEKDFKVSLDILDEVYNILNTNLLSK